MRPDSSGERKDDMAILSWTPAYTASNPTGVTSGTITVPTLKPADWTIKSHSADRSEYINRNADGGYTELQIASTNVSNPYGASKVAQNEQIPGLASRSAYVRLREFGLASAPADSACCPIGGLAGVTCSVNITLPSGVNVTTKQMQDLLGIAISALSSAITTGTVIPLSNVDEVVLGATDIK